MLAAAVHVAGGVTYETPVGVLTGATVAGVLYVLYRWGQVREKPTRETSDREKELEAEAGSGGML